jgi:hypothetical protein
MRAKAVKALGILAKRADKAALGDFFTENKRSCLNLPKGPKGLDPAAGKASILGAASGFGAAGQARADGGCKRRFFLMTSLLAAFKLKKSP